MAKFIEILLAALFWDKHILKKLEEERVLLDEALIAANEERRK
jgi:hypothetical protein